MATFVFDTHRAIQNLKEAGVAEAHAEAVVSLVSSAFNDNVATKTDVERAVERLEQRIEFEVRSLRSDMQAMEQRITLKLGGLMLAGLGLLFAALRFIP